MSYDLSRPDREDADIISYAAGHKAMGLYSMWAIRDEIAASRLLPADARTPAPGGLAGLSAQPSNQDPAFTVRRQGAMSTPPGTPFVKLSTGTRRGPGQLHRLALAAKDYFGKAAPFVHIVEGEGGLTPGRVAEALAAAGTASLGNAVVHLDFNQASIDSDRVCRENGVPGDYVQWTPMELFYLHDWNTVYVPDGSDFRQIAAGQRYALSLDNGQPTAIVYRTRKGWQYGIEGRGSHGAGHKLCSAGFLKTVEGLSGKAGQDAPSCQEGAQRCQKAEDGPAVMEECLWQSLQLVRKALGSDRGATAALGRRLAGSKERLDLLGRAPRPGAPRVEAVYALAAQGGQTPPELKLAPGSVTTLRGELGKTLSHYNKASGGAVLACAADLLGSTSISAAGAGFPAGYWNAAANPGSRILSVGGICEDAMAGLLSGLSAFGRHVGAGSSYGAFLAPLGHIAARLHAIGAQAKHEVNGQPNRPFFLICAHAGLKTGEDGPTHADPQCLQLLQDNFPKGAAVTLTPWEPQEIWPLVAAALARRPAVIAPFVTRPNEKVLDRAALGLAPIESAADGLYLLRKPRGKGVGTIVLRESAAAYAFVETALPLLLKAGADPWVYYVASAELFDMLPAAKRRKIFPEERSREAMGITGFTWPTMLRWTTSELGRSLTLHPFRNGRFLSSGPGDMVLAEAGLDGVSQFKAVKNYLNALRRGAKAKAGKRR